MKTFFLLLMLLNSIICNSQEGLITYKNNVYSDSTKSLYKPSIMADHTCFYLDSFLIMKRSQINIIGNEYTHKDSVYLTTINYGVLDVRNKTIYIIDSFAKRFKLIYKFRYNVDTTSHFSKFYEYQSSFHRQGIKTAKFDTLINNKKYTVECFENIFEKEGKKLTMYSKEFISCDQRNLFLHILKKYDEENDCHVKIIMWRDDPKDEIWTHIEIENTRNYLTKKERSIFKKWIAYIKKHPIK